jgi:hypothetical protein
MAAVGTRSPEHLRGLLAAAAVALRREDIEWLEGSVTEAQS